VEGESTLYSAHDYQLCRYRKGDYGIRFGWIQSHALDLGMVDYYAAAVTPLKFDVLSNSALGQTSIAGNTS
jgi:hypothetical protein